MKNNFLKTVLLIILLLLAVVLGQIIGDACSSNKYLSWLSASPSFGFSPVELNLSVIKLTFGAWIKINVAQAILILTAIISYTKIKVKE